MWHHLYDIIQLHLTSEKSFNISEYWGIFVNFTVHIIPLIKLLGVMSIILNFITSRKEYESETKILSQGINVKYNYFTSIFLANAFAPETGLPLIMEYFLDHSPYFCFCWCSWPHLKCPLRFCLPTSIPLFFWSVAQFEDWWTDMNS